jgi:hypothetical protein
MNKKETKNQVPAEAIKNADKAQTSGSSPFVAYMRKVVKKTEKDFPNRFLFLISTDPMEVGESSDCFAIVPQDSKFTAGILSALMVCKPEPLLESITLALHLYIRDELGEAYGDEFGSFMADLFKRATAEAKAKADAEAETSTDEK